MLCSRDHSLKTTGRTAVVVQWLRLCASTAGGADLIPGYGTQIAHALRSGQTAHHPPPKKKTQTTSLQYPFQQFIILS